MKEAVSVPVFANGNILYQSDISDCLKATGCDGVMSAEGQLYNPALFAGIEQPISDTYSSDEELLVRQPRHADVALEYLQIVKELKTNTNVSGVKGHLFKLMRPGLVREKDLREKLGKIAFRKKDWRGEIEQYINVCMEVKERMDVSHVSL